MGKRSRKRGGTASADRPLPPRASARPQGARESDLRTPASTFWGRVAESWKVAGERPSKSMPKGQRRAARPERPPGLWGPLPISEILMIVGIIGLVIGIARGPEDGEFAILASLAVIGVGAFEFAAREHFRGYKSHVLFLSLLTTVGFHALVAFVGPDGAGSSPALVAADAIVFGVVAWQLGSIYKRSRRRLRDGTA